MAVALVSLDEETPMEVALEIETVVARLDLAARAVEDTIAQVEEIIGGDSQGIDRIKSASR